MTHPVSVVIDCGDPRFPAPFWAPALGYRDTEWPTYNHGVLVGESGAEAALLLLQTDIEPEDKRLVSRGPTRMNGLIDLSS